MRARNSRTHSSAFARRLRELTQVISGLQAGELTPTEWAALRRLLDELVHTVGHTHGGRLHPRSRR
jgi:hypothetical protein